MGIAFGVQKKKTSPTEELLRLDFTLKDLDKLKTTHDYILNNAQSIVHVEFIASYMKTASTRFLCKVFGVSSLQQSIDYISFVKCLWSFCALKPDHLVKLVFELYKNPYSDENPHVLPVQAILQIFKDLYSEEALSTKNQVRDEVQRKIEEYISSSDDFEIMTLTGFEEFIRQRRDVLFPLLHNVQEVFQEKTLGKGRWKEIRQARLSKSDDDFMGPDVYMDHVMNKHKVFRGAYKILRKKQVEEVQKGINRTAVYASKAGPSAPNILVSTASPAATGMLRKDKPPTQSSEGVKILKVSTMSMSDLQNKNDNLKRKPSEKDIMQATGKSSPKGVRYTKKGS